MLLQMQKQDCLAVCKIIRDAGAEDILVAAGLCQEGTAKKMFGEKADYYQTMHVLRILSGAMWRLYWQAFEACEMKKLPETAT